MKKLQELLKKIEFSLVQNDSLPQQSDPSEEFEELCEELEDLHEEHEYNDPLKEIIKPILKIMENNPEIDFGCPGGLTHIIESFNEVGYENALVQSVEKAPTLHTVWLLNRLIRGEKSAKNKQKYLNLMMKISISEEFSHEVKQRAKEFLENHIN